MVTAVLPKFLMPRAAAHLVRLGSDRDGGYIVSLDDIKASDCLISLGVSDNWDFEADFLKIKKMPLIAYDGSVWAGVFFIRFLRGFVKFHKPWQVITRLMTFLSFLSFFKGDRQHIRKFVGIRDAKKNVFLSRMF